MGNYHSCSCVDEQAKLSGWSRGSERRSESGRKSCLKTKVPRTQDAQLLLAPHFWDTLSSLHRSSLRTGTWYFGSHSALGRERPSCPAVDRPAASAHLVTGSPDTINSILLGFKTNTLVTFNISTYNEAEALRNGRLARILSEHARGGPHTVIF